MARLTAEEALKHPGVYRIFWSTGSECTGERFVVQRNKQYFNSNDAGRNIGTGAHLVKNGFTFIHEKPIDNSGVKGDILLLCKKPT